MPRRDHAARYRAAILRVPRVVSRRPRVTASAEVAPRQKPREVPPSAEAVRKNCDWQTSCRCCFCDERLLNREPRTANLEPRTEPWNRTLNPAPGTWNRRYDAQVRIAILTNEYPPNVYGGAGVHVEYLTRELVALDDGRHFVRVLAFGTQAERSARLAVNGVQPPASIPAQDPRHSKLFDTLMQDLVMSGLATDLDIVHCHTWYSHFAGCLVKQLQDVPLVLTTHSLEPHRPWKVEQLGTAYNASSWIERTAYQNADGVVAVSAAMKHDVQSIYHVAPDKVRVIHNGIDLQQYR